MRKNVFKILVALLILSLAACVFSACTEEQKGETPEQPNADMYWKTPQYSSVLYIINANALTPQELETAASLQGIVAQTSASIFIDYGSESELWLERCKNIRNIELINVRDLWELIDIFKVYIKNGKYVLYESVYDKGASQVEQTVNYATVVSGVENYLMISKDMQLEAEKHDLTLGKDVSVGYNTAMIFDEYKDKLNNNVLIHQNPSNYRLRDYAVAAKAMCFYSDYYDGSTSIKNELLEWAAENAPVLGWTENEMNFVASNSLFSKVTLAADHCENLSFTSALETKDTYKPINYVQRNVTAQQGKHYLAVVMSDGDNLQWMQKGFVSSTRFFASKYRGKFPMTWTITPSMYNLAPDTLDYLYENGTARDQFIVGPSGAGYVNISEYNENGIKGFAQSTATYMSKTGLEYINFIDNETAPAALSEFAKYDSVKGGVMSVGNKYIDGDGSVCWYNDKPFISARETLWRQPGDDDGNKYYGFIERVAQRINAYSTNCTQMEGYTVLIAHAWSIGSMDYVNRFVDLLDEHVELVTVGELVDLVSKNVKHENRQYLNDILPSDIKDLAPIGSEQYTVDMLESVGVDTCKQFNFDDKNARSNYKWVMGNGGLQYDSAAYSTEGLKLDGSDLNDTLDPLPNSWAINKFALTESDKYLTVFVTHSPNADVNYRIRVLTVENGRINAVVLSSDYYEKDLNEYGWYKMNTTSPMVYVYDLTPFSGKTVAISIEQDDTGDGTGEIVFVSKLIISDTVEDGSNLSSWNTSDIAAYWNKSGTVVRHTEGICLEGKDASIYCNVNITGDTLKIAMRKFIRPVFQGQDITAYVVVRFNGEVVKVSGGVNDYIDVSNADENYYYTYDVSRYIGQSGKLEIISVEVNGVVGQHACISNITF